MDCACWRARNSHAIRWSCGLFLRLLGLRRGQPVHHGEFGRASLGVADRWGTVPLGLRFVCKRLETVHGKERLFKCLALLTANQPEFSGRLDQYCWLVDSDHNGGVFRG